MVLFRNYDAGINASVANVPEEAIELVVRARARARARPMPCSVVSISVSTSVGVGEQLSSCQKRVIHEVGYVYIQDRLFVLRFNKARVLILGCLERLSG